MGASSWLHPGLPIAIAFLVACTTISPSRHSLSPLMRCTFCALGMGEECDRLLGILPEDLRFIAEQRLQSFSCQEIADELGCAKRTVERRVEDIRNLWKQHGACS
jgi:hypothetical protein